MRGNPPDCRAAIPEDCATSKQPESGSCPRVFGELLDGPAIFLGLLLCAWWPLVEACTYGTAFWKDFLYDQAGRRFESGHFVYGLARNLGINLLYYPAVLVKAFLPWSLVLPVLAVRFWSVLFAHLKANRPLWLYVAAACLVELIFYLPANIHRSRYLMPVFPLMALFMGSSMNLLFRGMRPARTVMAGVLIILAYSAFDLLGGPEFSRSPYVQVLEKLKANGIEEGKIGVGPRVMQELPAQLRVMSGGKLEFVSVNPQEDGGPAVMLIREESGAPPNYPGYRAVDAGYGFMNKKKSFLPGRNNDRLEWALSALRGNEEGFRASSRTKYWLLFKR